MTETITARPFFLPSRAAGAAGSPARRPGGRSMAALVALAGAVSAASPASAQDLGAGQMSFLQCSDCHSPADSNGVGPGLKGVSGRRAGGVSGFAYSDAMKKSGIVWNETTLDGFLKSPRDAVPGTTMVFPGVDDPKERADLIAYLKTLK